MYEREKTIKQEQKHFLYNLNFACIFGWSLLTLDRSLAIIPFTEVGDGLTLVLGLNQQGVLNKWLILSKKIKSKQLSKLSLNVVNRNQLFSGLTHRKRTKKFNER